MQRDEDRRGGLLHLMQPPSSNSIRNVGVGGLQTQRSLHRAPMEKPNLLVESPSKSRHPSWVVSFSSSPLELRPFMPSWMSWLLFAAVVDVDGRKLHQSLSLLTSFLTIVEYDDSTRRDVERRRCEAPRSISIRYCLIVSVRVLSTAARGPPLPIGMIT